MVLIKINNVDCFCGQNYDSHIFINEKECIEKCIKLKCNVFIIFQNIVYYRSQPIKECIMSLVNCNFDTNLYIYIPDNFESYYNDIPKRVKCYTTGIYNLPCTYNNLRYDKEKLNSNLQSLTNKTWTYEHNSNLLKFLEEEDFKFAFDPYDNFGSMNIPTFVKSRNKETPKKSILLPLENLYIPNYYVDILNSDIPFNKKKKSCVWRGVNSGRFYAINKEKASREDLVLKHGKNDNYNIGLSCAIYKLENENMTYKCKDISYNIEEYVKGNLTIKQQLEYMFIISVEGNDFATNLSWIMLSNSVPLMPIPYVETWKMESELVPYIHYVPLNNDFSDLDEKMEWCTNNIDKCEEIAYMSKLYILQFFDKNKEKDIIKEVINIYKKNVICDISNTST